MSKKIKINDLSINYEIYGEGYPLLFIHGYGLHLVSLRECIEPLFEYTSFDGFKRIYVDLPGMGESTHSDSIQNSDDILEVMKVFIEEVIGTVNFSVIGESYGGLLSRGLAFSKPSQVDGMALICPVIEADFSKRTLPKHFISEKDSDYINTLDEESKEMADFIVVQNQRVLERVKKEIVEPMNSNEELLVRVQKNGYAFSYDVDNTKFDGSVLFLLGKHDSITGYEDAYKLLKNYKNATYVVFDNAGHFLHIEQDELFNLHMVKWIEGIKK